MSGTSLGSLALLTAALVAGGCREGAPTASAEADLELQAALTSDETAAVQAADPDRAEAIRQGASAIRWGIRPSVIEVTVHDQTSRYSAIVVGLVRRGPNGERLLIRHLVAWTGQRPTALLQVTSKTDEAVFGTTARGHWNDLVSHDLWVATSGPANLGLAATGTACPVQPAAADLHCLLASFDIRIEGGFQLLRPAGPEGDPIAIHTTADGVHGFVIEPAS